MKSRLLIAVFLLSWSLLGQTNRGAITGTVSDSAGALVPGAHVEITNTETGTKSDTVTTGTGNYSLLQLAVGTYTLVVEHPGFTKYEQTNIQVQVAVTTRVDVSLKVGAATESVTVTAESTLLKSESAEQSMTITGNQIAELPINFGIGAGAVRNPLSFIQMTPAPISTAGTTSRSTAARSISRSYSKASRPTTPTPRRFPTRSNRRSKRSSSSRCRPRISRLSLAESAAAASTTSRRKAAPTSFTAAPTATWRIPS